MANNDLGKNIRRRLFDIGKTQLDLARYCGVTQGAISAIIRGDNKPSLATAFKISQFLGVSVNELLAPAQPYYKGGKWA